MAELRQYLSSQRMASVVNKGMKAITLHVNSTSVTIILKKGMKTNTATVSKKHKSDYFFPEVRW